MTAALFAEALATLATICRAVAVWLVVGAVVATAGLLGGIAAVAWVVRGVWRTGCRLSGARRGLRACLPASEPESDPAPTSTAQRLSGPPSRPAPSWTHTDTDDQPEIEEAA